MLAFVCLFVVNISLACIPWKLGGRPSGLGIRDHDSYMISCVVYVLVHNVTI